MIYNEREREFSELLKELSQVIDITETQYKRAIESYESVGAWLAKEDSLLHVYQPEILPQGSFLLGTMTRPILKGDELDIDLVCRLTAKPNSWVQYSLKNRVGQRLKENEKYKQMLDKEGRRCWTLNYADSSKFHMDILPAFVEEGHRELLSRAFVQLNSEQNIDRDELAIRITDNEEDSFYTETNVFKWPRSNPFGYAHWFQQRANIDNRKAIILSSSVQPVPLFNEDKLPLQRIVQILKRHRDIMFANDEHRPISIIITTLAAWSYGGETDLTRGLMNVVNKMESFIKEKYDYKLDRYIKWIANPVNDQENFADKWAEVSKKENNFYEWLEKVKKDIAKAFNSQGAHRIKQELSSSFGSDTVNRAFENWGDAKYKQRENSSLYMSKGTGILTGISSASSTLVKSHNFHGE
ncbi:nucleotidyltransferase domain-containing protein [Roseivirga thermotolerans]|uniref:nucleotidyltransferase domain-containing protein n=1 Tax=Roseivirga thermotolerans TaxID=1758176 RepID=UPI00273F6CD5|nr:nucleotidyltransferase [Roseivirga thermotolerans]